MATVKDVISRLKGVRGNIAAQIWSRADVETVGEQRKPKIRVTNAVADEVLDRVDRHQDAEVGITWDTLESYLDEVLAERDTK